VCIILYISAVHKPQVRGKLIGDAQIKSRGYEKQKSQLILNIKYYVNTGVPAQGFAAPGKK